MKTWYTCTWNSFPAIREVMPFALVILSEFSQPQKDKHVLLLSVLHRFYICVQTCDIVTFPTHKIKRAGKELMVAFTFLYGVQV